MPTAISQSRGLLHRTRNTPRRSLHSRTIANLGATPSVATVPSWTDNAIAAYPQSAEHEKHALQEELARPLSALAGSSIAAASVYVNLDGRFAQAKVGEHLFRLQHGALVLLRSCVHCELGQFESLPITGLSDLGYALSRWEPRCEHCAPEDLANWLEDE